MIPAKLFLTKGVGRHKERLASFEIALRDAGIEKFNLVSVSSILPPNCKIIPKEKGVTELKPGQIVHYVVARQETDENNRLIAASIGIAVPADPNDYGYLSAHHSTICPGFSSVTPFTFGMILQFGGRMLETETRLNFSMPASRSASSKLASRSLCRPTPFVRNSFAGIIAASPCYAFASSVSCPRLNAPTASTRSRTAMSYAPSSTRLSEISASNAVTMYAPILVNLLRTMTPAMIS